MLERSRSRARRRAGAALVAASAALATVGSAHGELALFEFEGTIDSIEITYEGETFDLGVGDPVSYSYLIDLETPDLNNSSFQGRYEILGSSITIDGQTGHAGDPEFLRTWALDPDDNFSVQSEGNFGNDNSLRFAAESLEFRLQNVDELPVVFAGRNRRVDLDRLSQDLDHILLFCLNLF